MGRSTPSWIKGELEPPKAAVPPAVAALVRRQCALAGDVAVTVHSSALHATDAPIYSRLTDSYGRSVRASRVLDFV
jgi:hypothetical protein